AAPAGRTGEAVDEQVPLDDQPGELRAAGGRALRGAFHQRGRSRRPEQVGQRVPEEREESHDGKLAAGGEAARSTLLRSGNITHGGEIVAHCRSSGTLSRRRRATWPVSSTSSGRSSLSRLHSEIGGPSGRLNERGTT